MYRKNIKYTDFNGAERDETFYFNFGMHELTLLEWNTPGGIQQYMKTIIETRDGQKLADMFKWLINESYGVKSPDGRSFIKSKEVLDNFRFTPAYEKLFMALATDDKEAAEFVNGVFPKEAVEEAARQKAMAEKAGLKVEDLIMNQQTTPVQQFPGVAPAETAPVQPQMSAPVVPLVEGQVVGTPTAPIQ